MYISITRWHTVHCRAWRCMFLFWLKEANFDCCCFITRSFLPCSIYYSWVFHYTARTQVWLALDKKQEFKAATSFPYWLYHCWDYCRLDLSIDGLGKHVSGCWLFVLFHVLLVVSDFVLGFAQWSICSSLLFMLRVDTNFMESLPSNSENK